MFICYFTIENDLDTLNEMRTGMAERLHMQIGDVGAVSKSTGLKNTIETCLVDRELVDVPSMLVHFIDRGIKVVSANSGTVPTTRQQLSDAMGRIVISEAVEGAEETPESYCCENRAKLNSMVVLAMRQRVRAQFNPNALIEGL